MGTNNEVYEGIANKLIQYNQYKMVADQYHNDDISKFCQQKIVCYCNAVFKAGHFDSVVQVLEKMHQGSIPEMQTHIAQSLKDLQTEQQSSFLLSSGFVERTTEDGTKTLCAPVTQEELESSYVSLKDASDFIPNELVKPVAQNLQVKSEMEIFAPQVPIISNALMTLAETRYYDLTAPTTAESVQE